MFSGCPFPYFNQKAHYLFRLVYSTIDTDHAYRATMMMMMKKIIMIIIGSIDQVLTTYQAWYRLISFHLMIIKPHSKYHYFPISWIKR